MTFLIFVGIMLAFFAVFMKWLDYQDRHNPTDANVA